MIIGDGEPNNGTREECVKALLKRTLRDPARAPLNSAAHSATGLELSDAFTSSLEVRRWLSSPPLTARQLVILDLAFRLDLTTAGIAARLQVSPRTVGEDKHQAVATLVRLLWAEPPGTGYGERGAGSAEGPPLAGYHLLAARVHTG